MKEKAMRTTYTQLQNLAENGAVDNQEQQVDGLLASTTYLKQKLQEGSMIAQNKIKELCHENRTFSQDVPVGQDANYPHYTRRIHAITAVINEVTGYSLPLEEVQSVENWRKITRMGRQNSRPLYYFLGRNSIELYPRPNEDIRITIEAVPAVETLYFEDFSSGFAKVSENSTVVEIVGDDSIANPEELPEDVAGKWLFLAGNWYQIDQKISTYKLTLKEFYAGPGLTSAEYNIGQCPDLPEEVQELVYHYALFLYFLERNRDTVMAAQHLNMFWNGNPANPNISLDNNTTSTGILGYILQQREQGEDNSSLVRRMSAVTYNGYPCTRRRFPGGNNE